MLEIKDDSLYLVISEEYGRARRVPEMAKAAILGGVDIIQMREKDKPRDSLIKLARELRALCKEKKAVFIVNDDPFIAKEADANGVHLGQEDIERYPVAQARAIIGKDKIIGVSTHSICQFKIANESDIDYISFGPIFPTKTKDYSIGTSEIKTVLGSAAKPVFFIGGINLSNIDKVLAEGGRNIALIRGIIGEENITQAARNFKERLISIKG